MKLFEDKIRTDLNPANHIDNSFDFCDRNSQPKIEKVRNILNHWFSHYPEDEQYELKCRFQKEFDSALHELFLHELFLNQGFDIVIHPKLPHTAKTPDFLLSKNGVEFYLEAKVSTGRSNETKSYEQRLNSLYDSLNKIKSPNFFLGIKNIQLKTSKQPSTKELIKTVEAELLKYDVKTIENRIVKSETLQDLTDIHFENQDVDLSFYFIPKSQSIRGKKGIRPIGVYPSYTHWGGSEDDIKTSLEKKANRYGTLDKPYLIAINSIGSIMTNKYDADDAIWGSLQVLYSTDPNNRDTKYTRARNGFFLDNSGIRHTGVSGVLITRMNLGNIQNSEYWLYKHPWAKYEINFELIELSYSHIVLNTIKKVGKKQVEDILRLPQEWIDF